MRVRLLIAVTAVFLCSCSLATADAGVEIPAWVSTRQVGYTVRCPRQVASSLANIDWAQSTREADVIYVQAHPELAATWGDVASQQYWVRVYRQVHRELLTLCG